MTLILVGTGISFDLTVSGMEAIRSSDEVYIERYTNPIEGARIRRLSEDTGKDIQVLPREKVESAFLVERAKERDICLLASGDPLTATTHVTLLMDAKERGITVRVIHNSSIYSAAPARAGLQIYRFGKTASLVNPRPNYKPTSSLDVIRKNLESDMHSLVLLDTEPEPMEARAALEMLSGFESAVVLSRLGSEEEKVSYGKTKELEEKDLGSPPYTIIIPAKLHPIEEEYLSKL